MPCKANCDLRQLLLAKEEKIFKLQQKKRWVGDLGCQEPHRGKEMTIKQNIVYTKIVQTLAEAGLHVKKLASSCSICKDQQ